MYQHIKDSEMSSNQQTFLSLSSVSHIYLTTEYFVFFGGGGELRENFCHCVLWGN